MGYVISPMTCEDKRPVIDIFNHYITHSFAAYREETVSPDQFAGFVGVEGSGYPFAIARSSEGEILGFGMLSPYKEIPTFRHTAVSTYFLDPAATGRGIGTKLLEYLEKKGRQLDITILLAHISSENPGSMNFHIRNGFTECGRFVNVGRKNGCFFDMVWMQKIL